MQEGGYRGAAGKSLPQQRASVHSNSVEVPGTVTLPRNQADPGSGCQWVRLWRALRFLLSTAKAPLAETGRKPTTYGLFPPFLRGLSPPPLVTVHRSEPEGAWPSGN